MREITEIFVHCSATRPSLDIGADTIRRWHVDGNGWTDIGYHFVIKRDGVTESGRAVEIKGAHVAGHNAKSIGICMVGGVKEDGSTPDSNFTLAQWGALSRLLHHLTAQYPQARVLGHREADSGKACPSFDATVLL